MTMQIMKTPRSVSVTVTNRCNLRCTYCSHFESAGDVHGELPTEEWLRFINELGRCAVIRITLSGGDPFIREDLQQLAQGIVRNRMRFTILSNGTLITDHSAAFIASTARCDGVQVSIDGSGPATHDANRGKGSFVRAIAAIECLQKHRVAVYARITINRQNVLDLEATAFLLLEELGLPGFSTNSVAYMGCARQYAEQVMLTTEERCLAMETLLELNKKYGGRISATAGPLAEAERWLAMEQMRRERRENVPGGGCLSSCGGVTYNIAVRADGVMVPCAQLSHIELGRINEDDLGEVWRNHPELQRLRRRRSTPLSHFEFCRECEYIKYCTGNCPALAYTMLGDDNHPSPDACLRRFLEAGGRLPNGQLL